MKKYIAYTDGACEPNPGIGGWGYVIIDQNHNRISEHYGGETQSTNNRMEMMAVIKVMEDHGKDLMLIRSDSMFVINIVSSWRHKWKVKAWTKKKGPIKNLELVKRLDELFEKHKVPMLWVRGHSGEKWNEYADALSLKFIHNSRMCEEPIYGSDTMRWMLRGEE